MRSKKGKGGERKPKRRREGGGGSREAERGEEAWRRHRANRRNPNMGKVICFQKFVVTDLL